jgi:hypothetical protein
MRVPLRILMERASLWTMATTPTMTTSYWLPCFSSKPTIFCT